MDGWTTDNVLQSAMGLLHRGSKSSRAPYSYVYSLLVSLNVIFGTRCTELICNITIIDLRTSPTYCCYTTLGNIVVLGTVNVGQSISFSVKLRNSEIHTTGLLVSE